ncbi:MAG: tRNA lysidine(34) synthetase TilS, partial [Deltaproteobacteria bacterium]|nr:tRNA lysidine(34) synthetase TilS [Deltaproteobacteria bacterium]
NPFVTHFDLDELEFFAPKTKKLTLRVRGVLPGDKLRPFGLDGHKKLKDIFIDEKTPKSHRRLIPILTAGSGSGNILWVVGIRRSDFAKVTSATKRVLKIQFRDLK